MKGQTDKWMYGQTNLQINEYTGGQIYHCTDEMI